MVSASARLWVWMRSVSRGLPSVPPKPVNGGGVSATGW